MNPTTIAAIIDAVLGLASAVIPLIPNSGAGAASIGKVIETVTALAPLVSGEIGTGYTGIKNIIAALGAHPAASADQIATLQAFDRQVDDAWAAVEQKIDPDGGTS